MVIRMPVDLEEEAGTRSIPGMELTDRFVQPVLVLQSREAVMLNIISANEPEGAPKRIKELVL